MLKTQVIVTEPVSSKHGGDSGKPRAVD